MDYSKIDEVVLDFGGDDYPDFSDAYIISANYDGEPMTDEQLEEANGNHDFIYQCVLELLY